MRLTLRTLLAYLDDTLDPNETKAIGQKVSESPQAQELIARIKEVVRRRRLTTPPAAGATAKVDPNTIAEYIDNVLPPDQLAEVEEVCLDSDVYLAEVAACHQILTVILSEPALVPPTAKRRMYALVKGREAIPNRRATAAGSGEADDGMEGEGYREEDETLLLGLPLFWRKGGWFRRFGPVLCVLLLAVGLVFAIWYAIPHDQRSDPRAGDQVAQSDRGGAKEKVAAAPETPEKTKEEPNVKAQADVKPETKPEIKPETKPETKPDTKVETPAVPPGEPGKVTPPVPGGRREAGKYVITGKDAPSFLLQRRADKDPWQKAAPDSAVFTGDRLLALPGFRDDIQINNGVRLTLWGNLPEMARAFTLESSAIVGDDPAYDLDLVLDRGRVALANTKPQGEAKVRVRFQNESWTITLLQPQSEVALELWGTYPPGVPFSKDPGGEGPLIGVGLFALKGQVNLQVRYDTYLLREPPGRNLYYWDNTGPADRRDPVALPEDKLQSWARKNPPKLPKEIQAGLDDLQKRLNSGSVDDAVTDLLKENGEDRAFHRALGVFCLGALNDLPHLLDALANERHRDVRVSAINALRHWIGLAPDNDQALYRALESKYRSGPAEIIMTLLHNFSDRERADPATYETLMEYLKHDRLPIREMAYWQLALLVPDGSAIKYDPAGDEKQRESAYREWKRLIPEGQLPKASKQTPPPSGRKP